MTKARTMIAGALSADDIHKKKAQFEKLEKKVLSLPDSGMDGVLKKYCAYHRGLADQKILTWNSSERSVRLAWDFVNTSKIETTNIENKEFQNQLETWWVAQKKRKQYQRVGNDSKIEIDKTLSNDSLSKLQNQVQKFLKFVKHVEKGRVPDNFNSSITSVPDEIKEIFQFMQKPTYVTKQKEPNAEQIVSFLNYLKEKSTFKRALLSGIIAVLYDSGMRFSECATLKVSSLETEKNYFIANIQSSKTFIRSNILYLSAPYLKRWFNVRSKTGKEGLLFCNIDGKQVDYIKLANLFKAEMKKYNTKYPDQKIDWPEGKCFHYLRHLFASRSHEWSDTHRNYWLGWSQKGMMKRYGSITLEQAKEDYFKMIEKEKNPMLNVEVTDFEDIMVKQEDARFKKMMEDHVGNILSKHGYPDKLQENRYLDVEEDKAQKNKTKAKK